MKSRIPFALVGAIFLLTMLSVPFYLTQAAPPSYLNVIPLSTYNIDSTGFTVEFWLKVRGKPGFDPRIIRVVNQATFEGCGNPAFNDWEIVLCKNSCTNGTPVFYTTQAGVCNDITSTATAVDDGWGISPRCCHL